MNREEERLCKKYRRFNRWYASLTPDQRKLPSQEAVQSLRDRGYVDSEDKLTESGELYLHQLRLLEQMAKTKLQRKGGSDE